MTFEIFLILLTICSIVTSLVTEGIKKFLDSLEKKYASNVVVLIVAIAVGGAAASIFYLWNDYAWTSLHIIVMFLLMLANWLGAMLGYDKVIQAITQIKFKLKG